MYQTALAWGGPRRRDIIAMMGLAALLAACGVLAPASTSAANVWVDCAGGRDGNSGSADAPFQTLGPPADR